MRLERAALEQQKAILTLKEGHSTFLTGQAGVGKTTVIREWLADTDINVAITASTGIAAQSIGGSTIHSWAGIGTFSGELKKLSSLKNFKAARSRIESVDALLIEEISMLDAHTLNLVDRACKIARDSDAPFGGLQVVFSGDFGQLPPVNAVAGYCFNSQAWKNLNPFILELKTIRRQQDPTFISILREVRNGQISQEHFKVLNSRVNAIKDPIGWRAVRIMTHNHQVDEVNDQNLDKLPGKAQIFQAMEAGPSWATSQLEKVCLSPKRLELKERARVMFTRNFKEDGNDDFLYVNGTMGTVVSLDPITVLTDDGTTIIPTLAEWELRSDATNKESKAPIAIRFQYPLKLAFALTVHKSQGCTFDKVSLDLSKTFAPGQAYVALSRVRTLEGLNIEDWARTSFFSCSNEVKTFYERLRRPYEERPQPRYSGS